MKTSPTQLPTPSVTSITIPEHDLRAHVEDDLLVNAIRAGKIVQVLWSQLTPDERRAAYVNIFDPCGLLM